MTIPKQFTAEAADYREIRKAFWRQVSRDSQSWGGYYRSRLCVLYKNIIPPGARVLEIGCGIGDLLAAVNPAVGVGIDFCPEVLHIARTAHPALRFVESDMPMSWLSTRNLLIM